MNEIWEVYSASIDWKGISSALCLSDHNVHSTSLVGCWNLESTFLLFLSVVNVATLMWLKQSWKRAFSYYTLSMISCLAIYFVFRFFIFPRIITYKIKKDTPILGKPSKKLAWSLSPVLYSCAFLIIICYGRVYFFNQSVSHGDEEAYL